MFVRQMIGREAGAIIDLPCSAAQSSLAMGTCASVTDEEIAEAGLAPVSPFSHPLPEEMPAGYNVVPSLAGGFDIMDAGGVILNQDFIPNLAAARSFAHDIVASQSTQFEPVAEPPVDLERLTRAELDALAADRGVDITGASNKGDVIAALQLAAEAGK